MKWRLRKRSIQFPRRPLVMGIVNVNDDSFCADGTLDPGEAQRMARELAQAGADVIDVGAESARTNRSAISEEEELRRFERFLASWDETLKGLQPKDQEQIWPPILSMNTWRSGVVRKLVEDDRVELINDMGGLPDAENAHLCAQAGCSLLVMHSVGEPKVPHVHQQWPDIMGAMEAFFQTKLQMCREAGLEEERIVLDPGIDFAKQRDDNLTVYRELDRLTKFGRPLLIPISRKTVIGEVLDLPDPKDRDAGTIACLAACTGFGGSIFRVHRVEAAWQSVKVLHAMRQETA